MDPIPLAAALLICGGGFVAGYRAAGREARRLQRLLAHASHALIHDDLTGLPNRAAVTRHLTNVLASGGSVCVAMFDLDRFKDINDALGHAAGDDALRLFARHLTIHLAPAAAMVGRLHGDEFVAVFHTDIATATAAVTTTRQALSGLQVPSRGSAVTLQTSVGIASARPGAAAGTLLHHADAAMYQAKHTGSGIATYQPLPGQPPATPQPRPRHRRRDQRHGRRPM